MSQLTDDIHQAVAGVLRAHGAGLLSRALLVLEVVDEVTGELGLYVEASPADMPAWDRAGLLHYAGLDLAGQITACRVGDEPPGHDEQEEQ
ncbi:hypothetical protein [Kitasatospora cheerisanensis]|uniref:Uncharacterized protein n=1 Tax=Kitasatospora cheerisanensis KCTC 2395 TaxID=1348663 RepID=A0A066Z094_9ACTN|nr:hypothetical protein [Kitasatospora cheerisanensis]KDN85659.1 hypothetical protein KCH_25680 [Kitasatospora cheerisanensis KCTC 2395]